MKSFKFANGVNGMELYFFNYNIDQFNFDEFYWGARGKAKEFIRFFGTRCLEHPNLNLLLSRKSSDFE